MAMQGSSQLKADLQAALDAKQSMQLRITELEQQLSAAGGAQMKESPSNGPAAEAFNEEEGFDDDDDDDMEQYHRIAVVFKEEGPLGLAMREDDEGNSVLEEPKGKAQELGLCTGDVIVEVQGHACMGEAPARIRDRVVAAGRPLSVTVERPQ